MQFLTIAAAFALALVGPASALPSYTSGQCDTGALHCCDSLEPSDSQTGRLLLRALSLDAPVGSSIGLTCTPINAAVAGGGQRCNAEPVCCNGNRYAGMSLSCSPIDTSF